MTPLMLQDELVEEMKRLFSDYLYKAPSGERVPIKVYAQTIPINETDEDVDPVPYLIVQLNSGQDEGTRDSFSQSGIYCGHLGRNKRSTGAS